MQNVFKPGSRAIFKPSNLQLFKGVDILKLKQIAVAMMLVLPFASAHSAEAVNPSDFNQLQVKVDALEDSLLVSGLKGLRISGGIDPVYIYNRNKGTNSFAFLNNNAPLNGSTEGFSYDNATFGVAYLDIQKEMDDGTKLRLTLAPSKSAGSSYNFGNITHEATASIPIDGPTTRLIVGQIADVSGYQPFFNNFSGANAITSNQLYPGFSESFITKNMLFDFTALTFYTGAGVDLIRGPWDIKLILANANSARNDCSSGTGVDATTKPVGAAVVDCRGTNTTPTFIYNATYAQAEYWGFEFTGYEGSVTNLNKYGASRLDSFEIDTWYTRGDFNTNLQYTIGRQSSAANNLENGEYQDAGWWGISALVSERVTPKFTLAGRFDYLNNQRNGGGTFNTSDVNSASPYASLAGTSSIGDAINGFGPGDPTAADYDPNVGANRSSFSVAATYRLSRYAALRAEVRHDMSTKYSFYNFKDGVFTNTNDTVGLQTIVNF
jgi:hypothetical protein